MARKHPGRPSLGNDARTIVVSLKLSKVELTALTKASKAAGITISTWIRNHALLPLGLAIVLLVTGCAAKTWMPIAATSIAMTATACDWYQTHEIATTRSYLWEQNPLLGGAPSRDTVDGYFTEVSLIEASSGAILTKMPTKIRYIGIAAMIIVAGLELETIRENRNAYDLAANKMTGASACY